MDVARLQQLFALALSTREAVHVTEGGRKVSVEVSASASALELQPEEKPTSFGAIDPGTICAPCFGIVHLTPSPGAPPFVRVGEAIIAGQRLCLIEAMKVFHAVTADGVGRVAEILVASGMEVERGQPIIRLDANR